MINTNSHVNINGTSARAIFACCMFAKSAPLLIQTWPSHMPFDNAIVGCFFDFHDTAGVFSVRRKQ